MSNSEQVPPPASPGDSPSAIAPGGAYRAPETQPPGKQGPYREVTISSIVFGIVVGALLNASITYSGLKIGFTVGGSAVAAVLGWGVLRGILRKGTIVENNIGQTIASSVNTSNSGVIFTVPVLFLLGLQSTWGWTDWVWLAAACAAGAILGVAFIIPTRKQMIELDRLRFPTGTAVATVLRSPGEGIQKSLVLVVGILVAMVVTFLVQVPQLNKVFGGLDWPTLSQLGIPILGDETIDLTIPMAAALGDFWRPELTFVWAIAPFALGAGFITGRPGLVVLAGGILAYWVITPIAFANDWVAFGTSAEAAAAVVRGAMNRPLGIGMLLGGALVGLLLALPAMRGAFSSSGSSSKSGRGREEMPMWVLAIAIPAAFAVLFFAARSTITDGSMGQAALIAGMGTAWMWFAGIVIAQCTGMTDWSPISGIALVTVLICMFLTDMQVIPAVMIGAAVCVAMTLCADMMQDLKTGHLVGAKPIRQQIVEMSVVWIGPAIALLVVYLIAQNNLTTVGVPFGDGTDVPAAQAVALQAVIESMRGGDAPIHLYGMGAAIGVVLSLSGLGGLGVLVGLSMYLPLMYLLPYGLGCLIQMFCIAVKGRGWTERWGLPFAAGLLVGEGMVGVVVAGVAFIFGGAA
ncbi:OPT/YSL family transporter [Engelhardtia mirabilis]|uniref:OPT oligopeptide transporter protein n=1 Tax=Engelhardtia mirabilis TaxID=2528011 RepID=A0A518BLJ0_9BACT|nr:OPT oligopeptide transporter protein [Planctomycetes bacterium Pla133]QDV02160.1 OPT oligopeptide transporter protein [Planctomycetes bacterium Pla86]